jgi:hypothetical protein
VEAATGGRAGVRWHVRITGKTCDAGKAVVARGVCPRMTSARAPERPRAEGRRAAPREVRDSSSGRAAPCGAAPSSASEPGPRVIFPAGG